eukprot:4875198-Pleurochrysis_carterae.AAC.4
MGATSAQTDPLDQDEMYEQVQTRSHQALLTYPEWNRAITNVQLKTLLRRRKVVKSAKTGSTHGRGTDKTAAPTCTWNVK